MLANLAASLAIHGRIETTLPKAKELRSIADRLVTLGKSGTLAARRRALAMVRDHKAVQKAFAELAPRFGDRHGGYTRVLKLGYRHGDSAPMAMIEYIPAERKGSAEGEHAESKKAHAKKPARKAAPRATARKEAAPKARASKADKPMKKAASVPNVHKAQAKKSGRGD